MNCSQVLSRLTEIDRAIGVVDSITLRKMVHELQDDVLHSQKESIEELRKKKLRRDPPELAS